MGERETEAKQASGSGTLAGGAGRVVAGRAKRSGKSGNGQYGARVFEPLAKKPIDVVFPAAGIFVLESRHDRMFRMADTTHDFLKVLYVFSGEGRLVRGRESAGLRPGDIVLVPAGCVHRIEDVRPLSLYAVCVQARVLAAQPGSARELGDFRVYRQAHWAGEVRGLIRQLLHEQTLRRPGSEAMSLGLAWQLLGRLLRGAGARRRTSPAEAAPLATAQLASARVAAYARELERTFFEARSIDEAAAQLGLSRRRFTQLFRAAAGDSWLNTVRALRLAHARRLLAETGRSVASICYECGFEDLSNFYRVFRTAEGTSPDAWRKR